MNIPSLRLHQSSFLARWLLLGAVLLSLGTAIGFNLYREHKRVEAREQERLQAQLKAVQLILDEQLIALNDVLKDVSRDWAEHKTARDFNDRLNTLDEAMPGVRTLFIVDSRGNVSAADRPELLGRDFSNREFFKHIREYPNPDMLYISLPFTGALGVYSLNVCRMIQGAHGDFSGLVSATLDPKFFAPLLTSTLYASDMKAGISHSAGVLFLMMPETEGVAGKNLAQPGTFFSQHLESSQPANTYSGFNYSTGEERMVALRTIRPKGLALDRPLVVTASRRLDAIYSGWRRDTLWQGGLFLIVALCSCAGLFFYGRHRLEFERREAVAVQALHDNEMFLFTVTDNIPGMVSHWNADLSCDFANPGYLEWYGKTPEQMQGVYIKDLLDEEQFKMVEPHIKGVLRGEVQRFERSYPKHDGSIAYILAHYIPEFGDTTVKGFFVLVTDVTELKMAQQHLEERVAERTKELRESEAFASTIIAASPDCIKLLNDRGDLVYLSESGQRLLELDSELAVLGRPYLEFWEGSDHEIASAAFLEAQAGRVGRFEGYCATAQGTPKWWDVSISPLPSLHMPNGARFLAVSRDITERKGIEIRLIAAMKQAESANRTKSAFLMNLSHELRTPLNPIVALTDLMLNSEFSAQQQREYLQIVHGGSQRLMALFNRLFSLLELESYVPVSGVVDLSAFKELMLQELTASASAKGLSFEGSVSPELPHYVWVDMHLLQLVANELGQNAIRFSDVGGVSLALMLEARQGDRITLGLEVRDTGIGIPEERIAAISTGLTQSDDPLTKRYGGLGIGFAMIRKIVGLLGGSFEVRSVSGSGTTVRVLVPIKAFDPVERGNLIYVQKQDDTGAWELIHSTEMAV